MRGGTTARRSATLRALVSLSGVASLPTTDEAMRPVDAALAKAALEEQVAPLLGARLISGALSAEPAIRSTLIRSHLACVATEEWAAASRAPLLEALRSSG